MTPYSRSETLLGTALAPMDWPRSVSLVFAFSLFNALAAQFSLNVGPIPITGQTFAVTLTGALLGSRLGALALVAYLVEGCSGLPFFQGVLAASPFSLDQPAAISYRFRLPHTSLAHLRRTVGTANLCRQ
jgi:hypothetical protein